jgi:hypothetical protein
MIHVVSTLRRILGIVAILDPSTAFQSIFNVIFCGEGQWVNLGVRLVALLCITWRFFCPTTLRRLNIHGV